MKNALQNTLEKLPCLKRFA